jgi:hypothetical protein
MHAQSTHISHIFMEGNPYLVRLLKSLRHLEFLRIPICTLTQAHQTIGVHDSLPHHLQCHLGNSHNRFENPKSQA